MAQTINDMAQTWNAGGTAFTAIKMDVTNTASAAGSRLMDLCVGGTSQFSIGPAGQIGVGMGASQTAFNMEIRAATGDAQARIRALQASTSADALLSLVANLGQAIIQMGDNSDPDAGGIRYVNGNDRMILTAAAADRFEMHGTALFPSTDNAMGLGLSGNRLTDIYATNATIQTSDANLKEGIEDSTVGMRLLRRLRARSFRHVGGTRTHYGLVAQEVEAALIADGLDPNHFAAFIKTPQFDSEGAAVLDGQGAQVYRYGLRYGELIGPIIRALQELDARIAVLEAV